MRRYHSWPDWQTARTALAYQLDATVVAHLGAAYRFAAGWHGQQVRPGGEPYTEHLLETTEIVFDSGAADPDPAGTPLVAALLHDVVEDTGCRISDVQRRFGPDVAEQVAWLTKPAASRDPDADRAEYLARFTDAPEPVLAVKLADRYSNVQRLHTHPVPGRQRGYYTETVEVFLPLAARLPYYAALYTAWATEYHYLTA